MKHFSLQQLRELVAPEASSHAPSASGPRVHARGARIPRLGADALKRLARCLHRRGTARYDALVTHINTTMVQDDGTTGGAERRAGIQAAAYFRELRLVEDMQWAAVARRCFVGVRLRRRQTFALSDAELDALATSAAAHDDESTGASLAPALRRVPARSLKHIARKIVSSGGNLALANPPTTLENEVFAALTRGS